MVASEKPKAMNYSKAKRLLEIEDLLIRLKAIAKELPLEEEKKSAGAGSGTTGDPFLTTKSEFLQGMSAVKESLKEMKSNQGNTRTRDQIANAQSIRTRLKELSKQFAELEQLYAKEARKKKSKVGAEELANRAEFLQQFKRDLEVLKRLSTKSFSVGAAGGTAGADQEMDTGASAVGLGQYDTASFFKNLPKQGAGATASKSTGPVREVELSDMQQQQLDQISLRDQQFDDLLDQIGKAVELAGEKAKVMNDATELQNAMLEKLEENVDVAKEKMNTVNMSMKKQLEDKGMGAERFCINCVCCVILLGFIGLIVNTVL